MTLVILLKNANYYFIKSKKWTQELIQSDPHQILNIKRNDSRKKNRWQAELATLLPKEKHYGTFNKKKKKKYHTNSTALERSEINYWELKLALQDSKKGKRKVQGVPQSQTAALPRPQEEEETDKSKQAQIEQTYEKHLD